MMEKIEISLKYLVIGRARAQNLYFLAVALKSLEKSRAFARAHRLMSARSALTKAFLYTTIPITSIYRLDLASFVFYPKRNKVFPLLRRLGIIFDL